MADPDEPHEVRGEILPPQRTDLLPHSVRQLPYASPQELLGRMSGFLSRWHERGRAAAAVEVAHLFNQLYGAYVTLYATLDTLEQTRINHARSVDALQHLGEIVKEDQRARRAAAQIAAKRDELTLLQLEEQITAARLRMQQSGKVEERKDAADVELTPAEELKKAFEVRQALRTMADDLTARVQRAAGDKLTPELEEEIQRIKDDAFRLAMHRASES